MGREQHKVIEYLKDWGKLNTIDIKSFDDSGTLSHLLMLQLARFEEETRASKKRLPEWKPRKEPQLKETDAERQIAFSQEQRRRKAKEEEDCTQLQKVEHRDDRPKSRAGSGNRRDKQSLREVRHEFSVSRSIKRSRSSEHQKKHEPKISVESKRRRYSEPRSSSDRARKSRRRNEEKRSRRRHKYSRSASRNRRFRRRPPHSSPRYSARDKREEERHRRTPSR